MGSYHLKVINYTIVNFQLININISKMPASLFKESSAERFRRESQEMWEKVQSENTMKELSRQNSKEEKRSSVEEIQPIKVKVSQEVPRKAAVPDLFPRRVKSKLIRPKPALWETTKEETKNLKNTLLKKELEAPPRRSQATKK